MTKRFKYYTAAESWTKRPAWAFEISLTQLDGAPDGRVLLRCQSGVDTQTYHELDIPFAYLKQHLDQLFIRRDRNTVSLFLSAEIDGRFADRRGSGRIPFGQFAV